MSRARETLKVVVGRLAESALPHLAREVDEVRNTGRWPRLKRAIIAARLQRAQSQGDAVAIESALSSFWRGEAGDLFHTQFATERLQLFNDRHAVVIDALEACLKERGLEITRLVEIGCGDGGVLKEVARRLPQAPSLIGLDINAAAVARNTAAQPVGSRLRYVEAEAQGWLATHPQPGTVVLTNGGVLEYFSQDSFDALLQSLAAAAPSAIVMIEPVAPDHDLSRRLDSYSFGRERSFSHNHRHRLRSAGFEVGFAREMQIDDVRWMLMVGLRGSSAGEPAGSAPAH